MTQLVMPDDLRLLILHEAQTAFPRECCGLVEGLRSDGDDLFRVTAVHPARNLAPATDSFEIAPQDHIRALKAARANGHTLIGCYHSHPDGRAKPSARDANGAGEEDFLWLIAAGGQLAAYVYRRGMFCEVPFLTPA